MTTFATLNPVLPAGSNDPRDLKDNAENFDVAVNAPGTTWVDRLGVIRLSWSGLETQFANFLINQGFQFLGDYASGPITIGAQNQVFSRNGNYYRPGPSLVLPYTTVSNWAIDEPKFLVAGDGVLRNELTSISLDKGVSLLPGAQRIVPTIAILRTMPMLGAREVKVSRWASGGPTTNAEYERDDSDGTTPDDGFSCVVTTFGQRYKLKASGNWVTLAMAGGNLPGSIDDAAAWERVLATPYSLTFWGTSPTSRTINIPNVPRTIRGLDSSAKLMSQGNTNHEITCLAQGVSNVNFENFAVDANSPNRMGVLVTRTVALYLIDCLDCRLLCMQGNRSVGSGVIPGVGVAIGGTSKRIFVDNSAALDNGIEGKGADGFYCSGSNSTISNSVAERCTDTGFVLESCSYSSVLGCRSVDCYAVGAVTNASAADCYGNVMQVTGQGWKGSVTGGFQVGALGSGSLIDTTVEVSLVGVFGGVGPAGYVRRTGTGRVDGLNMVFSSRNGDAQGLVVEGARNANIKARVITPNANLACVQFQSDCRNCQLDAGSQLFGGTFGVYVAGTSEVFIDGVRSHDQVAYSVYAADASDVTLGTNDFKNAGVAFAGSSSGATLRGLGFNGIGAITTSATTTGGAPGSVVAKMPFYNLAGAFVGYADLKS